MPRRRIRHVCRFLAAFVLAVAFFWWCARAPAVHWAHHAHHKTLGPGVQWGVHNSYARQPVSWFGNVPQPKLQEQYQHGIRIFEIDAYWLGLMWHRWLVAHVPVLDQSAHVSSLQDASCALRQLGPDTVMFLDVKNFAVWPSCGTSAVRTMLEHLQACHATNPMTIMVDVSCEPYDNVACALGMQKAAALVNTTLAFRGMDFWWLKHDCSDNYTSQKKACGAFVERNVTGRAALPIIAQCHHCTRHQCALAMQRYGAPMTYIQVQSMRKNLYISQRTPTQRNAHGSRTRALPRI